MKPCSTFLLALVLWPFAIQADDPDPIVIPLEPLVHRPSSEMAGVVTRWSADRYGLNRRYVVESSPARRDRIREFDRAWRKRLNDVDFEALSTEGKVDYLLLDNELKSDLDKIDRDARLYGEIESMVPFAPALLKLIEAKAAIDPVDPRAAAETLAKVRKQIDDVRKSLAKKGESGTKAAGRMLIEGAVPPNRTDPRDPVAAQAEITKQVDELSKEVQRLGSSEYKAEVRKHQLAAIRASEVVENLRRGLGNWFSHYDGYDPMFSWWTKDPNRRLDDGLKAYARALREQVAGLRENDEETIVGEPIGLDGLKEDLRAEMIPYSPNELLAIADSEFAWCEVEMKKAAKEMGFGDDWKAALEKVKTLHVPPGEQPKLVKELAQEAVDFLEKNDLITVPTLAKEDWTLEMMSPAAQKRNPFFLGGDRIIVSFPTDTMEHEDKIMSMRANNIHFSRATVHHELIPGHHLQVFMTARYSTHRRPFDTPFWTEGWSLYWEMLLWDKGFPKTPEDRVGMLFWRMHRCARIVFSLKFHLGQMTPEEAIDYLVDRVGHERFSAEGEVRRSFSGGYSPLYQAAYMLGGLQLRALHEELVGPGKMTDRKFHDRILESGRMPIEMVRVLLSNAPVKRDYEASWKFAKQSEAPR